MNHDLLNRLQSAEPKKILAIDGGDFRAMIGIEVLTRLEQELRAASGQASLVLADYFDVMAGTHSGSWLATLLAAGQSMAQVRAFIAPRLTLLQDGNTAHQPEIRALLWRDLEAHLRQVMGDITLGSPALRSLLILVLRNRNTNSHWLFSNNPLAKYNDLALADCNLHLPLTALLDVSRKWHEPAYVSSETIELGSGKKYSFTDGMMTLYGNPAFLAWQICTAAPYKINFKPGAANILLVSVGNGKTTDSSAGYATERTLSHQAEAAAVAWDVACRSVGHCRFGAVIDTEYGDQVTPDPALHALFCYMRYEPVLLRTALNAIGLRTIEPPQLWENGGQPYRLGGPDAVTAYWEERNRQMSEIGRVWAEIVPMRQHFAGFL